MSNNYQYPIDATGKVYDIHQRIFDFIVKVLGFINNFPKTYSNQVCINQITRSVTSMGANDQEADGALTNKDFIHGLTIVRKEGKETVFWLKLLESTNKPKTFEISNPIINEGQEIIAIVSSIIKKSSAKLKRKI